ncbi:MAG: SDR family NAD(P)-dependent oxidoreductase [Lentisphaeria bacterium]
METPGQILITGAAGFIGYHAAVRFLEQGWQVVGIDNFNAYYDPHLKEARHAQLEKYESYDGIRMDLGDREGVMRLFEQRSFDAVVHLAAQAGVRYSLDHPFVYVDANLTGFLSVLEAVRHHGPKRLVYASSSSVYGGNTKLPFSEKDSVDSPVSLYAATKRANELMAHTYTHLYGIQTVGLRFFTVYGPWGRPDMAMWIFADKIKSGKSIPVYNYGNMKRDFTFIDDIVTGIYASATKPNLDDYEIFNLGNHQCEQLGDLIATIEKALGQTAEKELLPMQPGDVPATYADIERANTKLGYEPVTPISEGVPKFIEWFNAYHDTD